MIDQIEKAIEILRGGGTIAYPTDTTYGIGCDATNDSTVNRIFEAKGRGFNKPLGLAFSDILMIKKYCHLSNKEEEILITLLPGPFMILLLKRDNISDKITAKSKKVGIRIPDHKTVIKLVEGLRKPIITTSANISGEKDPFLSSEIEINVDLVIDGECHYKIASTVIDLENRNILRSGPGDGKVKDIFGIMQ